MKYTILLFLVFLISSCSIKQDKNLVTEGELANFNTTTFVEFVGPNPIDGAQYVVNVSCTDLFPSLGSITNIPKGSTIRIDLSQNCKGKKIPSNVLDVLTSTQYYYVFFIGSFSHGLTIGEYAFSDDEVKKIAQAPWKIQVLNGFTKDQFKMIRNTKNTYREAFEPTGDRNFYTEEEALQCDKYWKGWDTAQDEKIWRSYADKVLKCYRDLPPIK